MDNRHFEAIDQQIGSTSTSYGEAGQDFGFAAGRITLRGYDRGTLVMVNGVPMNLKAGRNDAAMRDFERVLALVPQSANAQSNIGIALVREKKYREAWRAFAQAAEINTTNPTVLMNQIVFAACLKE